LGLWIKDNSEYIKIITEIDVSPVQIFLRPSKFGKTYFCNMLYYYHDKVCTDQFPNLFDGMKISKINSDIPRGQYAVFGICMVMVDETHRPYIIISKKKCIYFC